MTPYFESLAPVVQQRLSQYLGIVRENERQYGLSPDLQIEIPVFESAGNSRAVGDKGNAHGGHQVTRKYNSYWIGNADPNDMGAVFKAIAPRLAQLQKECKGDRACVHLKYVAGPGQKFTPENVARILKNHPHLAQRMEAVRPGSSNGVLVPQGQTTPAPAVNQRPTMVNDPRLIKAPAAPLPPPPSATEALLGGSFTVDAPADIPSFFAVDPAVQRGGDMFGAPLIGGTVPAVRGVKSKKPTTSLFGL